MNKPIVSIIIVNYNGKEYVKKCIDSILKNSFKDLEIIVVDNGSIDESCNFIRKQYEKESIKVSVISLDKNYGPAKARNEGAKIAKGKYIGFLDNDTTVEKDWTKIAVNEFEADNKLGIIQCKLLLSHERDKIDYVGEYLGQNGFLIQRAPVKTTDKGQFDEKVKILAAKSAGMFIRKDVFNKINGFDEDYFIYVEETDLGWRSWLAGYEIRFIPKSIVYHEFGTSSIILSKQQNNYNGKFHGCKNYILTIIKNTEYFSLLKILPIHVILWIGLAYYSLFTGSFKSFIWIHKAIFWNILNLPKTISKRNVIQAERKISDKKLFDIVMQKASLDYFVKKVTISHKVGNAESFKKSK